MTIEHIKNLDRWNDCARLFYIDFNNTNNDVRVSIRKFNVILILYQVFEIFIMFEIKTFLKKYNVNERSLKKIKLIFIVM